MHLRSTKTVNYLKS